MNTTISVGLVGLGAVVRNIHVPAYARLSDHVHVVAGCDPNSVARDYARDSRVSAFSTVLGCCPIGCKGICGYLTGGARSLEEWK